MTAGVGWIVQEGLRSLECEAKFGDSAIVRVVLATTARVDAHVY